MKKAALSVLIVGCGRIAGVFDRGRSRNDFPYTHAGACSSDDRFNLVACVDPDDVRRMEFMDVWNVPTGFSSIDEILDTNYQFDVISICSPTNCHSHDLEIAVYLKPKLIFCEKPITTSLEQSEILARQCLKNNIILAVNYSRRFDPYVSSLRDDMQAGRWGRLRTVVGYYNKGIFNNGSHMVDLLHWLVGPLEIVRVGKLIEDFSSNDPSVPVWLEGPKEVLVHLACGYATDFSIFELQFVFSSGILIMEDGGLFWRERRVVDSETFSGYRVLNEGFRRSGKYPQAMLNAYDNIYRTITANDPLLSTGESALDAQRLCQQVIQQAREFPTLRC